MQVTLNQAATLIANCGTNITFMLKGQPGIGKSSILHSLAAQLPDYHVAYIDVTNLDLGDVAMPVIDRDIMVTNYAPNARFGLARNQHKPVLLMLDELTKATKPILNMLLPIILERRLGDVALPEGSIVFATGNLESDGVGDTLPGHAYNRMTVLDVGNPDADSWLNWAMSNDIAPEVCAFAKQYPQVFDRYDLTSGENFYIYNPLRGQTKAVCTPRSLAKASWLIKSRAVLGDALLPALVGTIGEAAARDMEAMVTLADQVPSFDAITKAPDTCRLPQGVGSYFLVAFMLAGRVKQDTMDAVMTYVSRFESFEAKALFLSSVAGNADKVRFAVLNRSFTKEAAAAGKFF